MRIYIHWPFCVSRCAYCDFNTRVAGGKYMLDYREALTREMRFWAGFMENCRGNLKSLYIGGGTPSTLRGYEIADLLGEINGLFPFETGCEITVEVNPATWSREDFAAAAAGGINRFSIGVQSLDDVTLKTLGRRHDGIEAVQAITAARDTGVRDVSVDLLYALPGREGGGFYGTLDRVLSLRPQHISVYALDVHQGTPLAKSVRERRVELPDEDRQADEYLEAVRRLKSSGYLHYEISNLCLPGHQCRHNLAYWRREEYLGLGAGSHSLLGRCRFSNTNSILGYIDMVKNGVPAVCQALLLEEEEELWEEIMLGLRTSRGVSCELHGGDRSFLRDLEEAGLLEQVAGRIRLTARGMFLSNEIVARLLPA